MSDLLIACGGTGGHLTPGIALAEEMERRGYTSLLLISNKSIDKQLTQKYPERRFLSIQGTPLQFTVPGTLRFLITQTRGFVHAWKLIRRERPRLILGFGGFTTAAVIVAGWVRGVPVALHEANRVPGRAVRVLARFARRVYLPRGVELPTVADSKRRHAGLPVRDEIKRRPRHEVAEQFGLDANRPTLVVLGGSQGARALNRWAEGAAPTLAAAGVQMLIVTGPGKGEGGRTDHAGPSGATVTVVSLPFCDDMAGVLSLADLVVSRSGAGTLAELMQIGVPALLVPYPYAADNHQLANAEEYANAGCGRVVLEDEVEQLTPMVCDLLGDETHLAELRSNLCHADKASTLELMYEDLIALAKGRRPVLTPTTSPSRV